MIIDYKEYIDELKEWVDLSDDDAKILADSLSRNSGQDIHFQVPRYVGAEQVGSVNIPLFSSMLKMYKKINNLEARVQRLEQPLFEFIHENDE